MGIFASIKKSKFIVYVINKGADGDLAVDEIFDFITKHKDLSKIAKEFSATENDIENIMKGMLNSGATSSYKGHFSPVSGVLFADTLAYLLRSERGQISKNIAYMAVDCHFARGNMIFEPEVALRGKTDGRVS